MARMKIEIKSWPESADKLVEVWNSRVLSLPYVIFLNKRPKKPNGSARRVSGFAAKSLMYMKGDLELVRMDADKYVLLMAKAGVEMEVTEVKEEANAV